MLSGTERDYLLERARSEVKRWGGSEPGYTHLAAALERSWPEEFDEIFPETDQKRLVTDRAAGRLVGTESEIAALLRLGDRAEILRELHAKLLTAAEEPPRQQDKDGMPPASEPSVEAREPLGGSTSATLDPGGEALTGPATGAVPGAAEWHKRSVVLVEELGILDAEFPYVGRPTEVTALLTALCRERRDPVVVTGASGSGRSALLQEVARQYRVIEPRGRVFRTRSASLGPAPAQKVQWIIEDAIEVGDVVLVVEDVDQVATLGTSAPELNVLRLLAWAATQPLRLVLVCNERYRARLDLQLEDLMARASKVHLGDLSPVDVSRVVDGIVAARGEGAAPVTPEMRSQVMLPRANSDLRAHPGLALDRLDLMMTRARITASDSAFGALASGEASPAGTLADSLAARVKGQPQAIEAVARRMALTLARLDLRPERPDGVFLFVGPTGVGKTELAKALAASLHGSVDGLIRLDMSEFAQEWAISRLTGPMPGYVGSTEPEAWLTTKIVNRPRSVVLLDEIEKAHPRVWNVFLQAFDAGRLSDSRGVVADLSEVVFVMTSNLGVREANKVQLGFGAAGSATQFVEDRIRSVVADTLPPEFIGRLDEIVVFQSLNRDSIRDIARQEVGAVVDRLRESGWDLTVTDEVIEFLTDAGYDPSMGARHLLRNIEQHFLGALASATGQRGHVHLIDGVVVFAAHT